MLFVNLEEKLFDAARRENGLEMVSLLAEAAANGVTRIKGEQIVERVYERLCAEGTEKQQNIAVDVWDITRNFCHPDNRIWPV